MSNPTTSTTNSSSAPLVGPVGYVDMKVLADIHTCLRESLLEEDQALAAWIHNDYLKHPRADGDSEIRSIEGLSKLDQAYRRVRMLTGRAQDKWPFFDQNWKKISSKAVKTLVGGLAASGIHGSSQGPVQVLGSSSDGPGRTTRSGKVRGEGGQFVPKRKAAPAKAGAKPSGGVKKGRKGKASKGKGKGKAPTSRPADSLLASVPGGSAPDSSAPTFTLAASGPLAPDSLSRGPSKALMAGLLSPTPLSRYVKRTRKRAREEEEEEVVAAVEEVKREEPQGVGGRRSSRLAKAVKAGPAAGAKRGTKRQKV